LTSYRLILTANVLRHGYSSIQFDNIFQQIGSHRCLESGRYGGRVRNFEYDDQIWCEQTERGNSDTFDCSIRRENKGQIGQSFWCTIRTKLWLVIVIIGSEYKHKQIKIMIMHVTMSNAITILINLRTWRQVDR